MRLFKVRQKKRELVTGTMLEVTKNVRHLSAILYRKEERQS
jgi:hypothetical protein